MSDFTESFVSDELIEKWMPIIEGTNNWKSFVSACPKVDPKDQGMMAQLFENVEALQEAGTSAGDVGDYSPVLIPMLRRIMPALIGPQIFGTQPMSGPTGLIFALRTVFAGDSVGTKLTNTNSCILTVSDATGGAGATVGQNMAQSLNNADTPPTVSATGLIRHIEGNNILVEVLTGAFTISTGATDVVEFDSSTVTNAQADATVSAVYDNEALLHIIFSNYSGTWSTAQGEVLSTDMKEIDFEVQTDTITAKTRKLKAKWTNELEQDLKAVHKMNAESLLRMLASDQIVMEMNAEFVALVETKAVLGGVTAWTYSGADGRWELEKYQNLVSVISRTKRAIAVSSKRGQATFMIVSPAILSVLETSGKLKGSTDPVATSFAGIAMGLKVFVNLWATEDSILLGYKGSGSEIDAGIFYGPYVPIQMRKGLGETDGQPRTFFSTRYGILDNLFGAENYYRKITTAGIPA